MCGGSVPWNSRCSFLPVLDHRRRISHGRSANITMWAPSLAADRHGILAGRHGVDAPVERMLRARPDLDARLLVVLAVAFHEAGLQRVDDHRRRLVEAAARFVHAEAEGGELAAGEAAAHAEAEPALGQIVQHRGLFGDPQRIVPGQDHGGGADIDVRTDRRHVGHQLDVVRHERVVVEVMFGRPEAVEAQIGGEARQPDLLVPHAAVGAVLPAVAGENHHHADIHGVSPFSFTFVREMLSRSGTWRKRSGLALFPSSGWGDAGDGVALLMARTARSNHDMRLDRDPVA